MSRHSFRAKKDGEEIHITMGWDRPCQGYFMVIFGRDDEIIYTNLDNERPHPPSFDRYLTYLGKQGLEIPSQMINQLILDGLHDAGNVFYDWNKKLNI